METYQILTLTLSCLSVLGVGSACTMFWKDVHDKKVQRSEKAIKAKRQEQQEIIREVVKQEVSDIKKDMDSIKNDLSIIHESDTLQRQGIQALLRDKLYYLYKHCSEKECVTIEEQENFLNLWEKYHNFGFNGVMDAIKDEFLSIPKKQ